MSVRANCVCICTGIIVKYEWWELVPKCRWWWWWRWQQWLFGHEDDKNTQRMSIYREWISFNTDNQGIYAILSHLSSCSFSEQFSSISLVFIHLVRDQQFMLVVLFKAFKHFSSTEPYQPIYAGSTNFCSANVCIASRTTSAQSHIVDRSKHK